MPTFENCSRAKSVDIMYVLYHSPNICPICCLHSISPSREWRVVQEVYRYILYCSWLTEKWLTGCRKKTELNKLSLYNQFFLSSPLLIFCLPSCLTTLIPLYFSILINANYQQFTGSKDYLCSPIYWRHWCLLIRCWAFRG